MKKLLALILPALLAGWFGTSTALAAIGTPVGIGTNGVTGSSATTLPITVTSAVAVNNTVIVTLVLYNAYAPTVTVSDSSGNSYTKDADIANSEPTRTLVFSGQVNTALTTSSTITINFNGTYGYYVNASAFAVSGIAAGADKTATATYTGSGTAASVGPTATTSQANELLIGAFGLDITSSGGSPTFAVGAGYTALPADVISTAWGIYPEYQIVSATGAYSASGTFSGGVVDWSAAIVTYKGVGQASQLAFTTQPANTTAGATMANVVVQLQDANGNNVASNNVPVTLSLSSGSFASGTLTVNSDATGRGVFTNLVITTAGSSYTMTAAASGIGAGLTSATSSSFNITPAAANTLTMTQQPSATATAGAVFAQQPTVTVTDQYGNTVTNGTTVTAIETTGNGGNLNGTTTAQTATTTSGLAAFSGLFVTNAATVTLTFSNNTHTVASSSIVVGPALANTLAMTQQPSASATAGTVFAQQPSVTVRDQYGNLVSNGTTVTATETSGLGNLNGTTTAPTATTASGVAAFSGLFITNSGATTLTFAANGKTVASSSITVSAANASQLAVTQQPAATATAGTAFTTQPKVTVQDIYGNTATTYATAITATETSGGNLNGTTTAQTATPSSGVATFSGLYVTNAASGVTLTFTSGSLTSATSTGINVSPAAASKLVFTSTAVTVTAGVASGSITVQRQDPYGNPNTADANRTVTLASTSTGTVTFNPVSPLTIANGSSSATFTYTDTQAGTPTITAASTSPTTITSGTQVETVTTAADSAYRITAASGTPTAGATDALTIKLVDQYQNVDKGFTGNKTLTFSGIAASPGGNISTVAGVNLGAGTSISFTNGVSSGTINLVAYNAGAATLAATDGTLSTASAGGTGAALTVGAAAQSAFRITAASSTPTAGASDLLTIKAVDQYQNTVTTYTGYHQLTFSGLATAPNGTAPTVVDSDYGTAYSLGTATYIYFVSGQSSASGAYATGGTLVAYDAQTATLAATDGTYTSGGAGGTGAALTVSPAAASAYRITAASSTPTAGAPDALTLKLVDQYQNVETGFSGDKNLTFSGLSTPPSGTLSTVTDKTGSPVNQGTATTITFTSGTNSAGGTLIATKVGAATLAVTDGTITSSGTGGTGAALTVSVGTQTAFRLSAASTTPTAGAADALTITAVDQYQNTVTSYTGSHNLTFSGLANAPGSTVPTVTSSGSVATALGTATAITFTSGVNSAGGSLVAYDAQTATLAVTDGTYSTAGTGGTGATLTVSAAAANTLTMTQQPSATATAGTAFAQQPTVTVTDQYGNTVTNGTTVTASETSGGNLNGTTTAPTATTTSGLATFSGLYVTNAATVTLTFTANAHTVVSSSIVVGPTAANTLAMTQQPSINATAGTVFAQQPKVTVRDQYGNLVSDGTTVTATETSGGNLNGTTAPQTQTTTSGVATFSGLYVTNAATVTLTFTANGHTVVSGSITVSAATGSLLAVTQQPSATATAGTAFATQPKVTVLDIYGNTATAYATAITATETSGGNLNGTTTAQTATPSSGVATFSGLYVTNAASGVTLTFTSGSLTSATSSGINVSAAAATKLVINTQPSATATAGVAFAQQPVIYIEDTYNNLCTSTNSTVTATRSAGAGTLLGTTNISAVAGVAAFTNLGHGWATNITIQFTSSGLTAATSTTIAVSPGVYGQLLVVAPGQTNAPGTSGGVGGTATAQTAGTAFAVKVMAADGYGNLVSTNDTVAITSSDATAVLPGNAALINGTNSFNVTLKDAGNQTVTATDVTPGNSQTGTSSAITVNAAALAKLQLLMPGETAAPGTSSGKTGTPNAQTAGVSYTVTVNAVDANWNLVNTNTHTVGITTTDPNDVLPANAALVAGTKTFSLTNKTAGSWTATATDITDGTKTASTSPLFTVNAGAFTKLQLLMPGEAASAGSATGKTGTPSAQTAGTACVVTVNAVDANWNLISTNDTVAITSSDANAVLPASAALGGGTQTFMVTFKTVGSQTVTASDSTNSGITPNTGTATTVNISAFAQLQVLMPGETAAPGSATGKTGTPTAQTAGASYSVTVRSVDTYWNLISTNDTVHLASSDSQATLPVNTLLSGGSVSLALTNKTSGSQTVTASDTTHTGIASNTGTAITINSAAASKLAIVLQPPATATAGVAFANPTILYIEDAYNNVCINTNPTVTATRGAGAGTLLGNTNITANAFGVASFTNLVQAWATNITIQFTSTGLTAATSSVVAISPNTYSQLLVLAPGQTNTPGTASGVGGTATAQTAGTAFAVKVLASDAYGNQISTNDTVAITSSDATAVLPGNAALINGTNSFNVTLKDAGNQTVTATDTTGSQTGTSSAIPVNAAALAKMQVLMPGETAAPGTTNGKTGTPNAQTAGASYSVIVNAVDANWNLVSTNDTVHLTSSDAQAMLPANTALSGGTVSLALTNKTAGSQTVTVSNVTHTAISANTGTATTINPAAGSKLVVKTEPSASATAGVAFSTQPAVYVEDTFGNVVTTDSSTVTAALASGSGPLQGTVTATPSAGVATFSNLADNKAESITLKYTDGGLTPVTNTTTIVVSPAAIASYVVSAASPQTSGVPFPTTVTAKDSFNNTVTTDNSTVVTMTGTGSVKFDSNGDGVYGDNTKTLTAGTFTINTLDTLEETVTLTATSTGGKTGSASVAIQQVNWYNSNWTYREKITISHTNVFVTDQTNFPVLVNLTNANVAAHALANGFDLLFTAGDGTNLLSYEREKYAGSNGALVAWVKVPVLSHTTDTVLYLYYGNSAATDQQQAANVWDANFKGVWHLKEATGATSADSTANANNGTPTNSPVQTASIIGGGLSFTGSANMEVNVTNTFGLGTNNVTMETWANLASTSLSGAFLKIGGVSPVNQGYAMGVGGAGSTGTLDSTSSGNQFIVLYEGNRWITTGTNFGTGWHHVVVVIDASGHPFAYLDGVQVYTDALTAPLASAGSITHIGGYTSSTPSNRHFTGILDEVRVSSAIRSAGWIQTEYTNQVAPAAFCNVGTEQTNSTTTSVVSSANPSTYGQPVTFTATVAGPGGTPTGTVQFKTNNANFGSPVTLTNGSASSAPISSLAAGTYTVTAVYSGDIFFNTSTGTLAGGQTVNPVALTITASAQSKTYGTALSLGTTAFSVGSGLVGSESVTAVTLTANGGTAATDAAGGYTITPSAATGTSGFLASNYNITYATGTLTVNPATLTVTANSASKPYGQSLTFVGTEFSTSGLLFGDNVTSVALNSPGAAGTAAVVGSPYVIVPSNATGTGLANYNINYVNGSLTVNQAPLTVTGITADNKAYDGTTTATIHTAGATLVGALSGDDVSLNTAGATGAFADPAIGTAKTVFITGLALNGASAANYLLTPPTATASITPEGLTVAGITAANKVYDGTTNATLNLTNAVLVGVISGDDVSLNPTNAAGAFADKTVGTAKTVAITGLALLGADAAKYTLTQPTTNADITAAGLTVTGVTAADKPYDGSTLATLDTTAAALSGVLSNDDVSLDATSAAGAFADANAGTAKPVSVTGLALLGADAPNYSLTQPTATASISAATVTPTITVAGKTYDATTAALITARSLAGIIGTDDVNLGASGAAAFADPNAGTAKPVTITGLSLSGTTAPNYVLSTTTASASADIAPLAISVTAAPDSKPYDGTTASTGVPTITAGSLAGSDTAFWTQTFDTPSAGTGKSLIPAGTVSDGNGGLNYNVSFFNNTSGVISALTLTVTGITADNKAYDGTTTATLHTAGAILVGALSGDDVSLNTAGATGAFADPAIGTAKTVFITGLALNGASAANYLLTPPTATASITPEGLTVAGITAANKVYDGTTNATLNLTNAVLVGVISGDDVSLNPTNAAGAFADKTVGTAKTVAITGLALLGADAAKYTLTQPTTNADITAAGLTVTGVTAADKPYDGSTLATLDTTAAALSGVLSNDDVSLDATSAAGAFADANAGTAKPVSVTGLALLGADAPNYSLTQPTATASISAVGLTVTGITANNKVYDGTTTAALNTGSASLAGVVSVDTVTLDASSAAGAFADANAGTGKTVSVSGVTISGASVGNYTLTQPATTADITPASSAIAVTSSANPSLPGANVTFTASVSVLPPGGGTVGGTVQFVIDGAPFGAPATISAGLASLGSSALAHGYHTVAAGYAGNGNYYGSTNSLNTQQLVNTPPVGANMSMSATKNQATNLSAAKLVYLCTDADGDAMSITAVAANSAQGGTVSLSGATITYTPPADYVGADSFTYTVSDSFGATSTGTVSVTVESIRVSPVIQNLSQLPDGTMQLKASGIPSDTYLIQASTDLNGWTTIGTNAANANGIILFTDQNATNYTSRFYRLAAP